MAILPLDGELTAGPRPRQSGGRDQGCDMELGPLLVFTAAFTVACAAPGPSIAALIARVLGRGPAGATAFCAGLVLGDQVWLAVAYLGLAALAQVMQPVF